MFNVVQIKTLLIETEREIIIVIFHEATALFPVSFNTSSAVAEDSWDRSVPHPVHGHTGDTGPGVMSCHVIVLTRGQVTCHQAGSLK